MDVKIGELSIVGQRQEALAMVPERGVVPAFVRGVDRDDEQHIAGSAGAKSEARLLRVGRNARQGTKPSAAQAVERERVAADGEDDVLAGDETTP